MTVLYEVETGHTKEVLRAFAKLYSENGTNVRRAMLQYGVFAAFFLMLPRIFEIQSQWKFLSWAVGIFFVVMAFKRDFLTYLNLLQRDVYYKNDVKIRMRFGNSVFEVRDGTTNTYRYDGIRKMYRNDEMFFLHMDNEDVFVIPRKDFVKGIPDEFCRYLQLNTEKDFEKINLSLGERFEQYQNRLRQKKKRS